MVLILIGICSSVLMFWTMAYGPGISPDSTIYIAVAKNLLAGNGFYGGEISVTHYPPFYSILLAIVSVFETGELLQVARLLHSILFGTSVCLIVFAVQKCTDGNFWASIFALLLFLSSASLILIYSMAWSESSFIILSLTTLLLLSYYCKRPSIKLLLAASITSGLAIVTRYIGITLLPMIVIGVVLLGNQIVRNKIRDTIIAVVVSCFPIGVWIIGNLIVKQSATNRTFAIHPIGLSHIESLFKTFYYFIFPVQALEWIQNLLIFGISLAFLLSTFKILFQKNSIFSVRRDSIRFNLFLLCLTFFFIYIAFLMISISFFDAHTPLDFRILAPAFLILIIAFITLTWSLFQSPGQKFIKRGLLCLAILSIALNSRHAILRIIEIHNNGIGYSSKSWRNSETIHYLKFVSLNDSTFTNGVDVLRFWTGMETMVLPNKVHPTTLVPNHDYKEQLQYLCDDVKRGNANIIFFKNINRSYLPKFSELTKCDLPLLMESNDGVIFGTQVIVNPK